MGFLFILIRSGARPTFFLHGCRDAINHNHLKELTLVEQTKELICYPLENRQLFLLSLCGTQVLDVLDLEYHQTAHLEYSKSKFTFVFLSSAHQSTHDDEL
jgi:hypothetical protein